MTVSCPKEEPSLKVMSAHQNLPTFFTTTLFINNVYNFSKLFSKLFIIIVYTFHDLVYSFHNSCLRLFKDFVYTSHKYVYMIFFLFTCWVSNKAWCWIDVSFTYIFHEVLPTLFINFVYTFYNFCLHFSFCLPAELQTRHGVE